MMKQTNDLKQIDARIWVYQSDRILEPALVALTQGRLDRFIASWTSHGQTMDAKAMIYHGCVLVIWLNQSEAQVSGCGIDKCVHAIQEIGAETGVDWLSRNKVCYKKDQTAALIPIHEFWAHRKAGNITEDTNLVDTTITNWRLWPEDGWVMFKNSWHQEMWTR
jgi:hypothetical protein